MTEINEIRVIEKLYPDDIDQVTPNLVSFSELSNCNVNYVYYDIGSKLHFSIEFLFFER